MGIIVAEPTTLIIIDLTSFVGNVLVVLTIYKSRRLTNNVGYVHICLGGRRPNVVDLCYADDDRRFANWKMEF